MHDVTGQSSCLVGKEILHLVETDNKQKKHGLTGENVLNGYVLIIQHSYFHLIATDYVEEEEEKELTWPSSSLRLDVRAMAGVSVSV